MGEEMEWANNTVLSFLKDLEGLPILWDTKSPQHKMAKRKCDIWSQLATKYNCPPDDLKRKWQSLQAAYRREKTREIVSGGQYKSRWFAYNQMGFFGDRYRPRVPTSNVENFETFEGNEEKIQADEDANEEPADEDTDIEEEVMVEMHPNSVSTSPEPRLILPNFRCFKRMKLEPHRSPIVDNIGPHTYRVMNRSSSEVGERNEYTIFGEYVAKKLSKMDDRLCAIVQHEIHNILFQAEMGHFRNCTFSAQGSQNNSDLSSLHSAPTPSSTSHHQTVVNTIYEMNHQ